MPIPCPIPIGPHLPHLGDHLLRRLKAVAALQLGFQLRQLLGGAKVRGKARVEAIRGTQALASPTSRWSTGAGGGA